MELSTAIATRRSIRRFSPKPVAREDLKILIEAARLAPSASNLQAWRFFIVTEPDLVHKINLFSPGMSGNPPAIIAIASDINEVKERGSSNSLIYGCIMDASMAAENIMLKAVELGLGTCAIKSYNDKAVRKLLNVPEHMRLELLITAGWPEGEPRTPKRKRLEDIIIWDRYGE